MRIVFCDDAPDELKQIKKLVKQFFAEKNNIDVEYVEYNSGDALLAQETAVDIAFLDVEMPGSSGIRVAEYLKRFNSRAKIFIVTAYRDYMDDAFDLQLFRYLSKPVDKNRLFRCLKSAVEQYVNDTVELIIETKHKTIRILSHQIVCVEGNEKDVEIQTIVGCYTPVNKLKDWRNLLELPAFFETYRGVFINMNYVAAFDQKSVTLRWTGGEKNVYLALRKYTEFKKAYSLYWGANR